MIINGANYGYMPITQYSSQLGIQPQQLMPQVQSQPLAQSQASLQQGNGSGQVAQLVQVMMSILMQMMKMLQSGGLQMPQQPQQPQQCFPTPSQQTAFPGSTGNSFSNILNNNAGSGGGFNGISFDGANNGGTNIGINNGFGSGFNGISFDGANNGGTNIGINNGFGFPSVPSMPNGQIQPDKLLPQDNCNPPTSTNQPVIVNNNVINNYFNLGDQNCPPQPPVCPPPKQEECPPPPPPKVEPPKCPPPKVECPPPPPPKVECPPPKKVDPPKYEPPKYEPPKEEPRKYEPIKISAPKTIGRSAGVFGDPHLVGFGGEDYDVSGKVGNSYNMISDKGLQYNATFGAWGTPGEDGVQETIIEKAGLMVGNDKVYYDNTGKAPTFNDSPMELNKKYNLDDNGFALWDGTSLSVNSQEYNVNLKKMDDPKGAYLDSNVSLTEAGPFADGIDPHGLLGQTADQIEGKKDTGIDQGKQGGTVIDGTVDDYEVSDLWSSDFTYDRFKIFKKATDNVAA